MSVYRYTHDGKLTTKFMTVANYLRDDMYELIKNVPTQFLKLNDSILWPGHDIKSSTLNSIITIDHYNITEIHTNCCVGISVGFPPRCEPKICCGNGCCC